MEEAKKTKFSDEEKSFLENYRSGVIERGAEEDIYYYTTELIENEGSPNISNDNFNGFESQPIQKQEKEAIDYSSWTVVRLKDLCRDKGLPVSGTKSVLIERIQNAEEEDSTASSKEINRDRKSVV